MKEGRREGFENASPMNANYKSQFILSSVHSERIEMEDLIEHRQVMCGWGGGHTNTRWTDNDRQEFNKVPIFAMKGPEMIEH